MSLESSDLIEQLLAIEREAFRLSLRVSDLERYRAPALEQGLSQLWSLQFGGEPPCTVSVAGWCTDIPCKLKCTFTFAGSFFTMTNQVVTLDWEGPSNRLVWSGCGIVSSVGTGGGCVSNGSTPVWITLTTVETLPLDYQVLIRFKLASSCPQTGVCTDTPNGSSQLSPGTGSTETLNCSPFDFSVVQGIQTAEFTPA